MPPMPRGIRKVFKRKEDGDRTPPKALYDDLESAHESITRQTSSSRSRQDARLYQSDENARLSNSSSIQLTTLNPVAKARVKSIALALTSRSSPASADEQTRNPILRSMAKSDFVPSLRHVQDVAAPEQAEQSAYRSSYIDDASQWQTVVSETGFDDGLNSDLEMGAPLGITPAVSQSQKRSDASSCHKSKHLSTPHEQMFVDSDTVDSIIHDYLPDLGPGRSHRVRNQINSSSEATSAKLCTLPYAESLHQFAWSPCSSDVDPQENFRAAEIGCKTVGQGTPARNPGIGGELSNDANAYSYRVKASGMPRDADRRNLLRSSIESSVLAGDLSFVKKYDPHDQDSLAFRKTYQFSDIVSDSYSSRPMSRAELEDSLGSFVRSALRQSSLAEISGSFSSTSIQPNQVGLICHTALEALEHRVGDIAGVSETSTTLSSFYQRDQPIVNKCSTGPPSESIDLHARKKTSPGLFGRLAFGAFKKQQSPPLTRNNSRLAQAAAAAGVRESSRLGRALADPLEWSHREGEHITRTIAPSSVASYGGTKKSPYVERFQNVSNGSPHQETPIPHYNANFPKGKIAHSPVYHRYNHSWSLAKNQATGSMILVPDQIFHGIKRSSLSNIVHPDCGAIYTAPQSTYTHPKPLSKGHQNPMNVTARIGPTTIKNSEHALEQPLTTQQKRLQWDSARSDISQGSLDSGEEDVEHVQSDLPDTHSNASNASGSQVKPAFLRAMHRQGSSTWLSTVSEVQSNAPCAQTRISSFAKTTVTGQNGNLTGTPDGTGVRETGSSLAGESSPGEGPLCTPRAYSESPNSRASSDKIGLNASADIAGSALDAFHQQLAGIASPARLKKGSSVNHHESSVTCSPLEQYQLAWRRSPVRKLFTECNRPNQFTRQVFGRRSLDPFDEDESLFPTNAELPARKRVGLDKEDNVNWQEYLPPQVSSAKAVETRDGSTPDDQNQQNQHFSRGNDDDRRICSEAMGSRKETRFTDMLESKTTYLDCVASQARTPSPLARHAISLDDPPRLYDSICLPDAVMKARHTRYSRIWVMICILVPFLGPLFGHGYLDRIMLWHSAGGVSGFRRQEKIFVLVYSYFTFAAVLIALAITMVILSK